MKIKKVRKQEMVTIIFMINQNLKILHTASFFLFLNQRTKDSPVLIVVKSSKINIILRSPFNVLHSVLVNIYILCEW